jgi:hypothetical protein
LLECRRRHPQLFLHGQLQPLSAPARSPWLAFARRHQAQVLLVIVRRGSPTAVPGPSLHAAHDVGTGVMLHGLPTGPMRNLLDGRIEHFKATGTRHGFWLAARWRYGSTRRRTGMDSRERRQRIEALAHQIWEAEGRPDDQQQRHWHMAERLVEAEIAAARDEEGTDGQP